MPGDRKGETLNTSGDRLIPTTGIHGGDISSQRVDELDSLCLNFVLQLHRAGTVPIAVDLGGGCGAQSRRMAELGADVVLIDLTDQRSRVSSFNKSIGRDAIHFYKRDVTSIDFLSLSASFNVIYSQRMMGCIRYGDLDKLFRTLYSSAAYGARCFFSTGGLDTEVGFDYRDRNLPVAERWAIPGPQMANKHQIFAPQCLYREEEFVDLIAVSGFSIVRSWTSLFGNPKVVAQKL